MSNGVSPIASIHTPNYDTPSSNPVTDEQRQTVPLLSFQVTDKLRQTAPMSYIKRRIFEYYRRAMSNGG